MIVLAALALLLSQAGGSTPAGVPAWVLLLVTVVGAVGGGTGMTALIRGATVDRRAQRLAEDKASREELESVRAENRQLRKEVSDLNDRAFKAEDRERAAVRDKERSEARLERVETDLKAEKERTAELAQKVARLEGNQP